MSNIYIQEPPTHGKILLETSVGDIDVELWSKEAPKACRNFVQLCLEGYYDGTIFHRIVKDFIAQGGDPTGTGLGGESIYGRPFRDEFHTRLRFVRRGLLAMANAGKDDNSSQFFFTFAPCPELQNKHTIFGKVAGNTIYNMLKLEDGLVNTDDRPLYPHKINATRVLYNPFDDIVPRTIKSKSVDTTEVKSTSAAKKNFKLLSFGDEAEEDEEEANVVAQGFRGKSKSSHDLTNDPHLSSLPALPPEESNSSKPKETVESPEEEAERNDKVDEVRKKLKRENADPKEVSGGGTKRVKKSKSNTSEKKSGDEDSPADSQKNNLLDIRKEVRKLKQEIQRDRYKDKEEITTEKDSAIQDTNHVDIQAETPAVVDDPSDYASMSKKRRKEKKDEKGNHEDQTLLMLQRFKAKLESARSSGSLTTSAAVADDVDDDNDESDAGWLTHTLNFESREALTKDANINNPDTFEIFDPRNPINQRRREASKEVMKEKARGSKGGNKQVNSK